jgi:hypothetical protein
MRAEAAFNLLLILFLVEGCLFHAT